MKIQSNFKKIIEKFRTLQLPERWKMDFEKDLDIMDSEDIDFLARKSTNKAVLQYFYERLDAEKGFKPNSYAISILKNENLPLSIIKSILNKKLRKDFLLILLQYQEQKLTKVSKRLLKGAIKEYFDFFKNNPTTLQHAGDEIIIKRFCRKHSICLSSPIIKKYL